MTIMKQYIFVLTTMVALPLSAQNVVDAARFASSDITGTARYRSMGGAFGALGGDVSCMGDNPAGIGIFRGTSQMAITPSLSFAHTHVDASEKSNLKRNDFSVGNLAYVASFKTSQSDHLVNFNVGVGFNHSEGVNRKYRMVLDNPRNSFGAYLANRTNNALLNISKYDDPAYLTTDDAWENNSFPLSSILAYDCYAIDDAFITDEHGNDIYTGGVESYDQHEGFDAYQRMNVLEQNRNDEYNFCVAANWDDLIYAGLTLSVSDFNSTICTEMNEDYQYDYQGSYTQYLNDIETKGSGVGIKLGILVRPTDAWRLGVAVHTPTWYEMNDIYMGKMITDDTRNTGFSGGETYEYKYRYNSPWEYQISSAWIIGTRGLFSIEYDMKDFTSQKYKIDDYDWDEHVFDDVNALFKEYMTLQHTFKAGLELRLTKSFSARLGYAHRTSPFKDEVMDEGVSRGWESRGRSWGDDNTLLFDSSTKPNYSVMGAQQFYSGGFGWHGKSWFIDLSVMNRVQNEVIAAFPTTDAFMGWDTDAPLMSDDPDWGAVKGTHVDMKTRTLNWDLTFGLRF